MSQDGAGAASGAAAPGCGMEPAKRSSLSESRRLSSAPWRRSCRGIEGSDAEVGARSAPVVVSTQLQRMLHSECAAAGVRMLVAMAWRYRGMHVSKQRPARCSVLTCRQGLTGLHVLAGQLKGKAVALELTFPLRLFGNRCLASAAKRTHRHGRKSPPHVRSRSLGSRSPRRESALSRGGFRSSSAKLSRVQSSQ